MSEMRILISRIFSAITRTRKRHLPITSSSKNCLAYDEETEHIKHHQRIARCFPFLPSCHREYQTRGKSITSSRTTKRGYRTGKERASNRLVSWYRDTKQP